MFHLTWLGCSPLVLDQRPRTKRAMPPLSTHAAHNLQKLVFKATVYLEKGSSFFSLCATLEQNRWFRLARV